MYNDKVTLYKREFIPCIPNSMRTVDCLKKKKSIINFTTDDTTSTFGMLLKNKMNNLYLTEITQLYWLQMLDDYWL